MTNTTTPPTLALIDGLASGHHTTYMRLLARAAAEAGWQVDAFLPDSRGLMPWLEEHAPDAAGRVRCHPFAWTSMAPPLWRLWSVYVPLVAWVRAARALRRAGVRPDVVCFGWLDDYIVGAHRFFLMVQPLVFPWRWTGLYFQPWHTRLQVGWSEWSATAERAFRLPRCGGVGILDEGAAATIRHGSRAPVHRIPDATDLTLPVGGGVLATAALAAAGGRKIIILAGGLVRRKGLLWFLDLVESCRDRPWMFLAAGEFDEGARKTFSEVEQQRIIRIFTTPPPNLMVHPERIGDEAEFNALIQAGDVVFAVYDQFANTSGILTKAGCLGRPVVVADGFSMAETVRKYRLGEVVRAGDLDQTRLALDRLCSGDPAIMTPATCTADFRRDYGYPAFRDAVSGLLRSAAGK